MTFIYDFFYIAGTVGGAASGVMLLAWLCWGGEA